MADFSTTIYRPYGPKFNAVVKSINEIPSYVVLEGWPESMKSGWFMRSLEYMNISKPDHKISLLFERSVGGFFWSGIKCKKYFITARVGDELYFDGARYKKMGKVFVVSSIHC